MQFGGLTRNVRPYDFDADKEGLQKASFLPTSGK